MHTTILQTPSFQLAANLGGNPEADQLALLLPGRLDTKNYDCFHKHLEYLADRGFHAVAIDPPGTWDSPGSIELFTTTNYIKAVQELIELFGNRPTLLLGHSRGGATATLAGANHPHVSSLVLINPSLGAPTPPGSEANKTGIYTVFRDLPPGTTHSGKKKQFVMSLNYFTDGAKYNDALILPTCTKPKIIFYSDQDEFNPPEKIEKLFATLPEPKELHLLHSTHDYRYYPEVVDEINRELETFLSLHL